MLYYANPTQVPAPLDPDSGPAAAPSPKCQGLLWSVQVYVTVPRMGRTPTATGNHTLWQSQPADGWGGVRSPPARIRIHKSPRSPSRCGTRGRCWWGGTWRRHQAGSPAGWPRQPPATLAGPPRAAGSWQPPSRMRTAPDTAPRTALEGSQVLSSIKSLL